MYIDLVQTMKVKNTNNGICCDIKFIERGWFSKEAFKLEGYTYHEDTPKKKVTKVFGNWNDKIFIARADLPKDEEQQQAELVWQKNPYPEKWASMYGLSHFGLQTNYFPKRLHKLVAPTDTRRRPD